MPGEAVAAGAIGRDYGFVNFRHLVLHPGQQRRPEVDADLRIIVGDLGDTTLAVQDASRRVWTVTFGSDALVPIVIGRGRILKLDAFQPGILARRLIKVTMNADEFFHFRPEGLLTASSIPASKDFFRYVNRPAAARECHWGEYPT